MEDVEEEDIGGAPASRLVAAVRRPCTSQPANALRYNHRRTVCAPADGGAGQLGLCPIGPPHTRGTQLGTFPREAQKGAKVLLMPPLLLFGDLQISRHVRPLSLRCSTAVH